MRKILSLLAIPALALLWGCGPKTTPAEQAIAEAVEAETVPPFSTPDLAFFDLTDHVKRYRVYTTYDIQTDSRGNYVLSPDAEMLPDSRPRTSQYTAVFDAAGNAIGDVLESVNCATPTTWRDTQNPGVHTRGEYLITRDDRGYVVQESGPQKIIRYNWRDGRLVKAVWLDPETEDMMQVVEYVYDNDGLLREVHETYAGDEYPEVTIYTDYNIDTKGNWTMRVGRNDTREEIFAEVRAIEYF